MKANLRHYPVLNNCEREIHGQILEKETYNCRTREFRVVFHVLAGASLGRFQHRGQRRQPYNDDK